MNNQSDEIISMHENEIAVSCGDLQKLPKERVFHLSQAGYWDQFSTSNNSTSLFDHWLEYRHCAKLPNQEKPDIVHIWETGATSAYCTQKKTIHAMYHAKKLINQYHEYVNLNKILLNINNYQFVLRLRQYCIAERV